MVDDLTTLSLVCVLLFAVCSRPLCGSREATPDGLVCDCSLCGMVVGLGCGGPGIVSSCYGGHSVGETPGSIPNPVAKPFSADGTALGRVWESRSPPDILCGGGAGASSC